MLFKVGGSWRKPKSQKTEAPTVEHALETAGTEKTKSTKARSFLGLSTKFHNTSTTEKETPSTAPRSAVLSKPLRGAYPAIGSYAELTFEDLLKRKDAAQLLIERTYARPATPPPLPAGPVFDPATGHLQPERLKETIDRALFLVPELPPEATHAQQTARGRLLGDLLQVRAVAEINRTHSATPERQKEMVQAAQAGSKTATLLANGKDLDPELKTLYEQAGRLLSPPSLEHFDREQAVDLLAELAAPLPEGSDDSQRSAHARLTASVKTCWDLNESPAMLPHEQGLHVRHACKAASRSAARLSRLLGAKTPPGQKFQALAGVLREMKRAHLTGAAPHISDEYSRRQAAKLNWAAPGLGERRSGAVLSSYKGVSLAYGHNVLIARLNGGLGLASNEFYFNDDEKGLYAQTYGTVALNFTSKVGFEAAAAARFNAKAALNTGGLGVGTPMVGNHNVVEVVKLLDQFNADAAWGRKSADPWVNDSVKRYQKARNFVSTFLGRRYAREPGAPLYLTETKLEKGLNPVKARLLAAEFDRISGLAADTGMGALVDAAYPPVQDMMKEAIDARKPGELPEMPRHGIHNTVVEDTYYGHTHQPVGSATAVADVSSDFGLKSSRGFKAQLETGGDVVFFPNWWPNAPHKVLDPKYAHDVSETFRILKSLDDLVIAANDERPVPPVLNLYAMVGAHLSGEPLERAQPLDLDEGDHDYFRGTFDLVQREMDRRKEKNGDGLQTRFNDWWDTGLYAVKKDKKSVSAPASLLAKLTRGKVGEKALPPDEPVPAQFHGAILAPDEDKLLRVSETCQFLGDLRFAMVGLSQEILARPDPHLTQTQRTALTEQREAAFNALNQRVWGGTYPGGCQAALRKPEDFVARTHAAVSTAFGLAGVHLSILKRQIHEKTNAGEDKPLRDRPEVMAATIAADENYQMARMLFDHDNLGIGYQKLLTVDRSTLEIYQMFRKITANSTKLTITGGSTMDVLNQITGASGHPKLDIPDASPDPGHPENDTTGAVFVTSNFGNVSASARARYQILDYQDAPVRQGTYLQFDIAATGGPLLGAALQKLMEMVVNKMAGTKSNPANDQLTLDKKGIDELVKQVQGVGLAVNEGTQLGIRLRKAPGDTQYKLQYIRPLMVKNSGLDISADIYTPVGVFTPGVTNTDFIAAPGFQRLGRDLYILLKQHANLKEAIDRARGAGPGEPGSRKHAWSPPRSLAQTVTDIPGGRLASELGDEIQANYFSSPDLLTQTISDYREAISAPKDPPLKNNEFHRLFHQGRFGRLARIGKDVENFAPGSKFQARGNPFTAGEDPWNTPIPLPGDIDEPAWNALKEEIEALPDTRARTDFFSRDPRGRAVLGTFLQILQTTNQIESASAVHHNPQEKAGFYTTPNPQLQKQLDRDNKNRRKGLPSRPPRRERLKAYAGRRPPPLTHGQEEIETAFRQWQEEILLLQEDKANALAREASDRTSTHKPDSNDIKRKRGSSPSRSRYPVADQFAQTPDPDNATRTPPPLPASADQSQYDSYFDSFKEFKVEPFKVERFLALPSAARDRDVSPKGSKLSFSAISRPSVSTNAGSVLSMSARSDGAASMLIVVPNSAGQAAEAVSQMFDWKSRAVPGLRTGTAPDALTSEPSASAGIVLTQLAPDFAGDNNPVTMAAVEALNPKLLRRFNNEANVVAMPNSGHGSDCLVLLLLQAMEHDHAETELMQEKALKVRTDLKLRDGMLSADSPDIPRILEYINKHHRPPGHPPLSLKLITPRMEGNMVYPLVEQVFDHSHGSSGSLPVAALQGANHYALLVMRPPRKMTEVNPLPKRTNL